jgi:hypothetical protein
MRRLDPANPEFWVRVSVSAVFLMTGFAVLLFGLGQEGTARLAAGWLGAVLGFWLR